MYCSVGAEVIQIYLLKAKFLYCNLVNNQTDRFELVFFAPSMVQPFS